MDRGRGTYEAGPGPGPAGCRFFFQKKSLVFENCILLCKHVYRLKKPNSPRPPVVYLN